MRSFDIIGGVVVVGWLAASAVFALGASRDAQAIGSGVFALEEGVTFITLQQGDDDRGVIREERTRLVEGWLIETSAYATFAIMGQLQGVHLDSKVSLDDELRLRSASGEVEAFGMHLRALAQYDGEAFDVTLYLDGEHEQFTIPLATPPELVGHAIPRLLAGGELEPGATYEQDFIDPMTLAPTDLSLRYVGEETIRHYGEEVKVHRFVQAIGSQYLDVLVDARGEVVQQGFPFRIRGSRLPEALATSFFRRAEEAYEALPKERPDFLKGIDAGDLLTMASYLGGGQIEALTGAERVSELDLREVGLLGLDERSELHLESPRQRVMLETDKELVIQVGPLNPHWPGETWSEAPEVALPEDLPASIEAMARALDSDDQEQHRQALAQLCSLRDGTGSLRWPEPGEEVQNTPTLEELQSALLADDALPAMQPQDCLAAVHLAARSAGHKVRMAHGFNFGTQGFLGPRVWMVAIRDDGTRYELDPLRAGELGADHLQIFLSPDLDTARIFGLFKQAQVSGG
ncbi:hypothetical protein DV096_04190 [Bradymonadaceae bacterium TMQ3]|uniref:DUF4340 domain-containing protein n=1 Tax=Lujinxingia sediminis TaxID=2480984 RepID=A0ABY0CWC5_9DELT|nr:hypothetical protein [Lujinxingia sediminis]RDV39773.1 hypothetical protein DV096_04190 [Bradymonadaceae bacterium TMQ3]RVU48183.1 hypothetical protein EA187_01735 [Lujinxingia sediminis]TXC77483.1 hypothetical protein FRC91_01745 [Bradymonadales bacterium TMQ1]